MADPLYTAARAPSRDSSLTFFKNFVRSSKIVCLVKKNAILHKEFVAVSGLSFRTKNSKALVLLSYKKFSPRFARKEKEGGDRSKFCKFSNFFDVGSILGAFGKPKRRPT